MKIIIDHQLDLTDIEHALLPGAEIVLSDRAINNIQNCHQYLLQKLQQGGIHYGINTGFGSLCDQVISATELGQLQVNLLLSHACGTGAEVPAEVVKLMLLLKIQNLALGHSGVQLKTVETLIAFFNKGLLPVVYEQGSLGASGDLAPLAHLALPLIGEGHFHIAGEKVEAAKVLQEYGIEPVALGPKEGLALINGTQFMLAYGFIAVLEGKRLWKSFNTAAAISITAFDARKDAFEPLTHQIRPHAGQLETARFISELLADSQHFNNKKSQVQDPYTFRCIPQVHGASLDVLQRAEETFLTEARSVSDNPLIFPKEDRIISGGNFHGQPLAITLDTLAIALSELGNISERRVYQLISGQRGLPVYLSKNAGLNSGFMIPQYTAASIVSQNKQLCTPASADSIVSSNGQEDHVSMGANAATKLYRIIQNCWQLAGIEWLNASQALALSGREKGCATVLLERLNAFRKVVPIVEQDVFLHPYLLQAALQARILIS